MVGLLGVIKVGEMDCLTVAVMVVEKVDLLADWMADKSAFLMVRSKAESLVRLKVGRLVGAMVA